MKKIKILIIFLILFSTSGCWNYQELNELAVATSLAIDQTDDDQYEVSILIANSKKSQVSTKEGESSTTVISGKGHTISEALKDIDLKSPKQIYLGHLAVIVINDNIAKDGLLKISDFILREPESVKRFLIVLARDNKAKSVIKILSPLEAFPSQNIYSNLKISNASQPISTTTTYSKFIEKVLKKGSNPILPSISVSGDVKDGSKLDSLDQSEPDAEVKLGTIAIFKSDKLLGYANKEESKGINLINNEINEMNITTLCPNDDNKYVVTKLTNVKSHYDISFKNNKPIIDIYVKSSGELKEVNCKIDLTKKESIDTLEKAAKKNIKNLMKQALELTEKKYKSDIFDFGNAIYKKNPTFFKKHEKDWDTYFSEIEKNIHVDINIESKGSLENSLEELK